DRAVRPARRQALALCLGSMLPSSPAPSPLSTRLAESLVEHTLRRKERNPMAQFPDTPSFTGFNTPSRIEADIRDLQHIGTIPPELDGAFYRVQPDPQFPPRHGD